jgi:hypothetical protein
MGDLKLHRTEIKGENGETIRLVYNENDDILDIFFGESQSATAIELTDHILLRLNLADRRAIGLTLLHFSILTERTEYGPRSFPLDNLMELPEDLRELVVLLLTTAPVNKFLKISFFQESPSRRVPLTYVDPYSLVSLAVA